MKLNVLSSCVLMFALSACARGGTRPTIYIEAGKSVELTHFDPTKQSLVIEFQAGETLPLDIDIHGDYVESPKGATLPLTVKRHCFLRVDDRGPRLSDDGKDFDKKSRVPGSFQFGVGVSRATGKRATLRVVTPQR
jgi:hypothetical protein